MSLTPDMAFKARHSLQEAANAALIAFYSANAPFQQGWHLNQVVIELRSAAKFPGFTLTPINTEEQHEVADPQKSEPDSGCPTLSNGAPVQEPDPFETIHNNGR